MKYFDNLKLSSTFVKKTTYKNTMGRGDQRTKKGKITAGTYGVRRPRPVAKATPSKAEAKAAAPKTVKVKAEPKAKAKAKKNKD